MNLCDKCFKNAACFVCADCKSVSYCSELCQKKDWHEKHLNICKKIDDFYIGPKAGEISKKGKNNNINRPQSPINKKQKSNQKDKKKDKKNDKKNDKTNNNNEKEYKKKIKTKILNEQKEYGPSERRDKQITAYYNKVRTIESKELTETNITKILKNVNVYDNIINYINIWYKLYKNPNNQKKLLKALEERLFKSGTFDGYKDINISLLSGHKQVIYNLYDLIKNKLSYIENNKNFGLYDKKNDIFENTDEIVIKSHQIDQEKINEPYGNCYYFDLSYLFINNKLNLFDNDSYNNYNIINEKKPEWPVYNRKKKLYETPKIIFLHLSRFSRMYGYNSSDGMEVSLSNAKEKFIKFQTKRLNYNKKEKKDDPIIQYTEKIFKNYEKKYLKNILPEKTYEDSDKTKKARNNFDKVDKNNIMKEYFNNHNYYHSIIDFDFVLESIDQKSDICLQFLDENTGKIVVDKLKESIINDSWLFTHEDYKQTFESYEFLLCTEDEIDNLLKKYDFEKYSKILNILKNHEMTKETTKALQDAKDLLNDMKRKNNMKKKKSNDQPINNCLQLYPPKYIRYRKKYQKKKRSVGIDTTIPKQGKKNKKVEKRKENEDEIPMTQEYPVPVAKGVVTTLEEMSDKEDEEDEEDDENKDEEDEENKDEEDEENKDEEDEENKDEEDEEDEENKDEEDEEDEKDKEDEEDKKDTSKMTEYNTVPENELERSEEMIDVNDENSKEEKVLKQFEKNKTKYNMDQLLNITSSKEYSNIWKEYSKEGLTDDMNSILLLLLKNLIFGATINNNNDTNIKYYDNYKKIYFEEYDDENNKKPGESSLYDILQKKVYNIKKYNKELDSNIKEYNKEKLITRIENESDFEHCYYFDLDFFLEFKRLNIDEFGNYIEKSNKNESGIIFIHLKRYQNNLNIENDLEIERLDIIMSQIENYIETSVEINDKTKFWRKYEKYRSKLKKTLDENKDLYNKIYKKNISTKIEDYVKNNMSSDNIIKKYYNDKNYNHMVVDYNIEKNKLYFGSDICDQFMDGDKKNINYIRFNYIYDIGFLFTNDILKEYEFSLCTTTEIENLMKSKIYNEQQMANLQILKDHPLTIETTKALEDYTKRLSYYKKTGSIIKYIPVWPPQSKIPSIEDFPTTDPDLQIFY